MKLIGKLLLAAGLTGALSVEAGTIFFRGGEVYSAELTSRKVNISNFDEAMFPQLADGRIYAAVTMKIPAGRRIGITDYRLIHFGHEYPCVAIRVGNSSFRSGVWEEEVAPDKFYTLLFVLDKAFVGLDDQERITLQCAYKGSEKIAVELTFANRRDAGFHYFIPPEGRL